MSNDSTQYVWCDYDPRTMQFIESWLDKDAVKATGLDDGFCDFYEYWANEDGFDVGVNYWCKVVCENNTPVAVVAFCRHEQMVLVMEIVVKPQKRGQGVGTRLLKELLGRRDIITLMRMELPCIMFIEADLSHCVHNNGYIGAPS